VENSSKRKASGTGLLILLLCVTSPLGRAQNFHGSLVGIVEDSQGGRVPSAQIVLHALESALERQTTSDNEGEFRLDDLLPGSYHVIVNAKGFQEARSDVMVVVSSVRTISVRMKPAALRQTVNVRGEASSITTEPIDTTSAVHQGAITLQDLQTIPLAHRSFANIAYLVPGTEPVEPSDPTKARITAVSSGGSSGLNIELSVDGGDNSDDYIGGFLQNFSPDAIQQFSIRTAQMDADTSRTTGSSVVIMTRRGTDDWHGDAAFYERAAALNARYPIDNPAPNPKQPFSRQNYVGTLGGPIRKGKLWFFSSFEYVREDASIAYSSDSLAQFNALASLAAQGLIPGVNSIAVPNSVTVPFHDYLATARVDWAQSSHSQWFLRLAGDSYLTHNDLVQQATLPSTGATSHSNYLNFVLSQQYMFNSTWLGSFIFDAGALHHTQTRNANLGFALAFPFSSTAQTISGFETFGDNQFVTPITAFPVLRNQQKYQFRYDVSHASGKHAPRFGIGFIHEPVLSGALAGTAEKLTVFGLNPVDYVGNTQQFTVDRMCTPMGGLVPTMGTMCSSMPASNGSFVQNVQRLGLYAEDSWRVARRLTVNYGLRYDTTFGLFIASGRSQLQNPVFATLKALQIPFISSAPHDYRAAFAPRLGIAYAFGQTENTVIRAGVGLYYNDLAQNGWVNAFRAVNSFSGICIKPGDPGCIPPAARGGLGAIIDPDYKTPYALHATAGIQHSFNPKWALSADWTHEQGVHAYRRYNYQAGFTLISPLFPSDPTDQMNNVPDVTVFRSDNRSRYDAMSVHLQGNVSRRFNLIVNYTLASANTWGCVLGELFDYVNGVCDPLHAFAKGDYGPSGEDVRHRLVVAGTFYVPGGFQLATLSQAESARPFTLTTTVDVNGFGDTANDRAVVNGVQTTLDQFRGSPYVQIDLRVSRPFNFHERWSLVPFIEFFNLLNRSNPGNNFVTNVAALPVPPAQVQAGNITDICVDPACTTLRPITSPNQLRQPAGALGDFFGPGTTVGIPFAAQMGVRLTF
jgi:Carboxypeptidase regulatory-like domain/TonB dependent receptor